MFDIANYWLDDTRKEMQEWQEYKDGKRWFFWPRVFNWDKTKPVLDEQGRAVEKLEQVRLNDINGPLADQALFFAGSVADVQQQLEGSRQLLHPDLRAPPQQPAGAQGHRVAIMAKNLSTGGPEYDGRKAAEARKLVDAALRNYPEMANDAKKSEFLIRQLQGITLQQAAKDFEMAEFWEKQRTSGSGLLPVRRGQAALPQHDSTPPTPRRRCRSWPRRCRRPAARSRRTRRRRTPARRGR